jgi:hypothetical protein
VRALTGLAIALLLLLLAPRAARALDVLERYEEQLIAAALRDEGLTIEPAPEGKRIERIVVVTNDVLLGGDFRIFDEVPVLSRFRVLNRLHVRTREYIVKQELLFSVGQRFRRDLFEESGRNLRGMFINAVARLVACRGSTPDDVVVLVVTKDQWTLRLNTNFVIDQARLDALSFSISESNLAGRNKTASLNVALDPGRLGLGDGYTDPRIWSSRHAATVGAGVYLNRATGGFEGFYASGAVGRPLFSLRTRWAWQISASYLDDIFRNWNGGTLLGYRIGDEIVPDVYTRRVASGVLAFTRSWGVVNKANLSFGWRVDSVRYALPADFPSSISEAARAVYLRLLPRSEDASGPYVSFSAFSARFVRLQNINTYALTEDFRLGPSFTAEARYADPIFGFNSRFLNLFASYNDTRYVRGDLISFGVSLAGRIQAGVWPGTILVNQDVQLALRNISPKFGPFRLHVFGALRFRGHDLDNVRLRLGSDSGLRAVAPRGLSGNNRYQVNVELRTLPLNLWTLHVGAVIFYDGGDAPRTLLTGGWKHGAGVGLRILIPQFNRDVLRLDLAFPFQKDVLYDGGVPVGETWAPRFSAEFGQAF